MASPRRLSEKITLGNVRRTIRNPRLLVRFVRALRTDMRQDTFKEEANQRPQLLAQLLDVNPEEIAKYERELQNPDWADEFADRTEELQSAGAIEGTTGKHDRETLYILCRAVEPDVVFETGVLYGAFDTFILAALEQNDCGELHSLDLPGSPDDFEYGYLIPDSLRDRWTLHLGDAKAELEPLLSRLDVDLFLHDSKHTRDHMLFEYETAADHLSTGDIIASHDVPLTTAWRRFCSTNDLNSKRIASTGIAEL